MKKSYRKLILSAILIYVILLASYLIYLFLDLEKDKEEMVFSTETKINSEVILFEDTFFEFLNERFDQLAENNEEISDTDLQTLADEAVELIEQFSKSQSLSPHDLERINQLKFYTFVNVSLDNKKTREILDQLSPGEKKYSLLKSYIATFTPLVKESEMTAYLKEQNSWVNDYDEKFLKNISLLMFLSSPIGKKMPDFIHSYRDLKNNYHQLEDFKGKFVLVDFWATWCSPCLAEIPYFIEGYNQFGPKGLKSKNKFDIVSISLDRDLSVLKKFIAERGIGWINYGDGNGYNFELVREYKVDRIPTLYLLSPEGIVVEMNLSGKKLLQILNQEIKL